MIRTQVIINSQPLVDMTRFASDFGRVTGDLGVEVGRKIVPQMLEEMQHYPPKPPKSKYKRTYTLKKGMAARVIRAGNEVRLVAESKAPYSKWVVGTFDRRRKWQTRFHAQRWPLIAKTTDFWQEAFVDEYTKQFDRMIDTTAGKFSTVRRNR